MALSQTFKLKYGPWALVTGASKGLGAEFARQIGGKGLNLVLVARGRDELAQVKEEVRKHSNVEVKTVVADLSRPDFMEALRRETDGLDVGLLVCNAAQSLVGLFFEQSLEVKLKTVEVNCRAVLILVHEYGGKMLARKRGGIIMLSSGSALQGVAYAASYAATKAYNLILAESLWDELRDHGVDVLGFMPGATHTPGYDSCNPRLKPRSLVPVAEAGSTVAEALTALGRTPSWIPGRRNRWSLTLAQRLLPRKQLIKLVGSNMRQMYGK